MHSKIRKDFVNKLKIVEEEIDETTHWLGLIIDSEMLPKSRVEALYNKSLDLCKIITKSISTFKVNRDIISSPNPKTSNI